VQVNIPLFDAEIKNEWCCTSSAPLFIHDMHNENFTLTLNHLLLEPYLGRHDTDHRHFISVTGSDKHMVASGTVKIISYSLM
jgi:hypothetical protein